MSRSTGSLRDHSVRCSGRGGRAGGEGGAAASGEAVVEVEVASRGRRRGGAALSLAGPAAGPGCGARPAQLATGGAIRDVILALRGRVCVRSSRPRVAGGPPPPPRTHLRRLRQVNVDRARVGAVAVAALDGPVRRGGGARRGARGEYHQGANVSEAHLWIRGAPPLPPSPVGCGDGRSVNGAIVAQSALGCHNRVPPPRSLSLWLSALSSSESGQRGVPFRSVPR